MPKGNIRPRGIRRTTLDAYDYPADDTIGPRAFKPYLDAIRNCHCKPCRQVSYANRPPHQVRADARALLDALRAGTHVRVEFADYAAEAKREHAARVAARCADGGTDFDLYMMTRRAYTGRELERFYGLSFGLDFYTGIGIGMTPGRHAERMSWWENLRARVDAEHAARIPALVAKDPRNACAAFRMSGEVCTHHAMPVVDTVDLVDDFVSPWSTLAA
jgi:hypothetical protein